MANRIRMQNMTAHPIGPILPGQVMDLDFPTVEGVERYRKSAAYRAKHVIELRPDEPPRPMPRPDFPSIENLDETTALNMVEHETDLGVLASWHSEEMRKDERGKEERRRVIRALEERGAELARAAPPAPIVGHGGVIATVPGAGTSARSPSAEGMRLSGAPKVGGPPPDPRTGSPTAEEMRLSGAPPLSQVGSSPVATSVAPEPHTVVTSPAEPVAPPPPPPPPTKPRK